MNTSLSKLLIGSSGIVASYVATKSESISPEQITQAGSIFVQIIIGIITLFGLFKKKK